MLEKANPHNSFSILDIFVFIKEYIGAGGLISILFIILTIIYFIGLMSHRKMTKDVAEAGFSLSSKKIKVEIIFFNFVNRILDFMIGKSLEVVHKNAWEKTLAVMDRVLPDALIERFVGLNRNLKERVEFMNREFPVKANNFWHHTERTPDNMDISPIISGRWFNGQPVEKYFSSFISKRSFYIVMKSGLFVTALSFLVLVLVYRPHQTYGYQPASVERKLLSKYEDAVAKDPTLHPKYRVDVWNIDEAHARNMDAKANARQYATEILANAKRYNYQPWGWIFTNGYLTAFFLAVAIGLAFIRRSYFNLARIAGIPYIKDTHEDYNYEVKEHDISSYKQNLSAMNIRGTRYDRLSPLFKFAVSTGKFMEKGVIGAYKKGAEICQSLKDFSQNTIIFGSTGTGKTRSIIIPLARLVFQVKSMYLADEEEYNRIYDIRRNRLTDEGIAEGRLTTYKPLHKVQTVISCAIMDIKAQVWKDLWPEAKKCFLQNTFLIVGPKEHEGQVSVDPLSDLNPEKLRSFLNSMQSQMGAKGEQDFWTLSGLDWIIRHAYVAYLYNRTLGGEEYLRKNFVKPWSLAFIYEILNDDRKLFSQCLIEIRKCQYATPERISDILNTEAIDAIYKVCTDWKHLTPETKHGIQANMDRMMNNYSNSALRPFMTGVGANTIEVGEFWGRTVAFDLDIGTLGTPGKLILLFLKTLIYEEAVKRQIRFSKRQIDLSEYFIKNYPETMIRELSPEFIPLDCVSSVAVKDGKTSRELLDEFIELCNDVQQSVISQRLNGSKSWNRGEYLHKLKEVIKACSGDDFLDQVVDTDFLGKAMRAKEIATEFFERNTRFKETTRGLVEIDPNMFNAVQGDSPEVAAKKQESMSNYYEYEDLLTRIEREHFFFICDEYQELITTDPTGGCYTDSNIHNIIRSTNVKSIIATQTKAAIKAKVGADAMENFLSQMRNRIYLKTEDKETIDEMVMLAGECDVFRNPIQGKVLTANGIKQDGYTVYKNFNWFLNECVEKNISGERGANSPYQYKYDIFAAAEPIDIDFKKLTFSNAFSGIFAAQNEFNIPTLKDHFLSTEYIHEYVQKGGTSSQLNDNADQIKQAWREAKSSAKDKYHQFLKEGYQERAKIFSETDVTNMSNLHAFITIQRCGMTKKDHVIVSSVEDYEY